MKILVFLIWGSSSGPLLNRITSMTSIYLQLKEDITTWHEDIYGESDDEEDEVFSEVVEATEEELERLQLTDRLQPANKEIHQQLQSTRLEPKYKTKQSGNQVSKQNIGIDDLAQILQISNGALPNIEPLRTAKDDAKEWFDHYDMITKSYGWNDYMKGIKLPIFLKKDAQRIFRQIEPELQHEYKTAKATICRELMEEERALVRASFFQVAQKQGESPAEYGQRLKKMISKLDFSLKVPDLIEIFTTGLRPELRLAVMGNKSKTLEEAIKYAKKASQMMVDSQRSEEISNVNKSFEKPHIKEQTERSSVICYYCAENGHIKSECSIYKKAMTLITCKLCGKRGHVAKHCRAATNDQAPTSRDQGRCNQ